MNEVKGNSGSTNSSSPTQPSTNAMPNITSANQKTAEKPLASTASILHPLPKNQPAHTQAHSTTPATTQPVIAKTHAQNPNNIQFNSAVGSKNSQKINPFAEQNAKRVEREKARAKKHKKVFTLSLIAGGICVTTALVWIVINIVLPDNTTENVPEVVFQPDTIEKDMDKLQNLASEAYNPSFSSNDNGETITATGDLTAVEDVYDKTLSNPQNEKYANEINLSRLIFYINNGFYEPARQIVEKINPESFTTEQKATYYGCASMTYYYSGDYDKSKEYMQEAQKEQAKLGGIGG